MPTICLEKFRGFFQMAAPDVWADDEANHRDVAVPVQEAKVVPSAAPHKIRLKELPDTNSSITVSGYTRVYYMPTQSGQFFVDVVYGYVYFYSTDGNKLVEFNYMGMGSIIDAADINAVYKHIREARKVSHALRASAQNPNEQAIKILPGTAWIGSTEIKYLGHVRIFMGPGGDYQVSAMTANHYNKILFTLDKTKALKKYEGTPAAVDTNVTAPSMPAGEIPVCVVLVQDDGTGTAGTIKNIPDSAITDLRRFLSVPQDDYRQFTIHLAGLPYAGKYVDGYAFRKKIVVDKITVLAESAPTGSYVELDLMRNGGNAGRAFRLNKDARYTAAIITALTFNAGDIIGVKVLSGDSLNTAAGLNVVLDYRFVDF